jgi:hypothetical protein
MRRAAVLLVVLIGGLCVLVLVPQPVVAHGGGLDGRGCHNDRKNGGYHCHRGPLSGQSFGSAAEAAAAVSRLNATPPATATKTPTLAAPALPRTPAPATSSLTTTATAAGALCGLTRLNFDRLVAVRMGTYETTGDSWSPLAAQWRQRIESGVAVGRATSDLDGAYGRYSRYCAEGDSFMAGLVVGEWIGLALRVAGASSTGPSYLLTPPSRAPRTPPPAGQPGPPPSLNVTIEHWADGWKVVNQSPGYTWSSCEAQNGSSTAKLPSLEPKGATIINRADFRPALSERGQLVIVCRAGGVTFMATEKQ